LGSKFEGHLEFEQTFRIDGQFRGEIRSSGDLIVGQKGDVEGEIEVGAAVLAGQVRGTVRASRKVEIQVGARVNAEIYTPALIVQEGARFDGHCHMELPSPSASAAGESPGEARSTQRGPRLAAVKGRNS
jgi:cytoskeletal protein CcmA (bactofilin family)